MIDLQSFPSVFENLMSKGRFRLFNRNYQGVMNQDDDIQILEDDSDAEVTVLIHPPLLSPYMHSYYQ